MNFCRKATVLCMALIVSACGQGPSEPRATQPFSSAAEFELPIPISNNAVAAAEGPDGPTLYSFNGLKSGKSWKDASNAAFACIISIKDCEEIASVPVNEGRLASSAVTVADTIYLFGGYTVAEDGDEVSTPEVFAFDPQTQEYKRLADMPTPVDDMVVLPYRGRYIYLVSGWHDEGNVSLVQLYDTQSDSWSMATEFPGKPVFGHAGGLANNSMIITDGVAVAGLVDGKRKFVAAPFSWRGDIDPDDPTKITWRAIDAHPGGPQYRMAAMGDNDRGLILFAGGGGNPYNYDGIGYDGMPANPTDRIFGYDLKMDQWTELGKLAEPSMDHRALVKSGNDHYIIGGMEADQAVTARIMKFRIDD
ncbi:kelch repeat-containing protein [Sphingorhabdus sp. Alg231-15]|uniref:kelch repeat-containing protein n=1 Tax=Sphingorhabdus sp. Alg231-15 TaxID=1922222 RepID=UPI000D560F1A